MLVLIHWSNSVVDAMKPKVKSLMDVNSNEKSTPARPEERGGIVGETPTHNLQQFSKDRYWKEYQLLRQKIHESICKECGIGIKSLEVADICTTCNREFLKKI